MQLSTNQAGRIFRRLLIFSFMILLFLPDFLAAQDEMGSFEFDGYTRGYEVYLPQNFEPNMPLVVSIHGYSETIAWYKSYTEMHVAADTMGFVLVYPQGIGNSWNVGVIDPADYHPDSDDVSFISTLIDTMKSNYDIDLSRVYACGFSLGGMMSFKLAGEHGHRFAAIASVAGSLFGLADSWEQVLPMPVMYIQGTADGFVPYNGSGDYWSAEKTLNYWVNNNQCASIPDTFNVPDTVPEDNCIMQKITYNGCNGNAEVVFYKGINMGHSWPQSKFKYGGEGNKNMDINANVEILKFFGQYTNPYAHIEEEFDDLIVAEEVFYNDVPPEGFSFLPGRILNDTTIWFCGYIDTLSPWQTYVWRSMDGGATFTHNETGIPGRATQMDAFDENVALVATWQGYIYRTTDGGATWNEVYSYSDQLNGRFKGCRVLNENVAVAYGNFEGIDGGMHFVSTNDKGANWTEIEGIDYLGAMYGSWSDGTAACNFGESIWCVARNDDSSIVFRSYDRGVNWESFRIPEPHSLSKALLIPRYAHSIAFSDDDNGMIGWHTYFLLKTTDGGATWSATVIPDSTYIWDIAKSVVAIPGTDNIVALGGGVYYTSDLGATWGQIATPAETDSSYFRSGMFYNKEMGYVFTGNGLVLRFRTQVPSRISPRFSNAIPGQFQLNQNYPNPFNPSTTIEFTLPKSEYVTLKVFNILGKEVTTLVSRKLNSGKHTYTFNGSNLASGVYYYQLVAGDYREVKKMILLR